MTDLAWAALGFAAGPSLSLPPPSLPVCSDCASKPAQGAWNRCSRNALQHTVAVPDPTAHDGFDASTLRRPLEGNEPPHTSRPLRSFVRRLRHSKLRHKSRLRSQDAGLQSLFPLQARTYASISVAENASDSLHQAADATAPMTGGQAKVVVVVVGLLSLRLIHPTLPRAR